jgi:integration host factor subunit beta
LPARSLREIAAWRPYCASFTQIRLTPSPIGVHSCRVKVGCLQMLRSELVARLQERFNKSQAHDVEQGVDLVLEEIAAALEAGRRVELRGFGAFSIRERKARKGRNPRTGAAVKVKAKRVPFFKPGKELRVKVNGGTDSEG